MSESVTAKDYPAMETQGKTEYACLFCMAGREETVARELLRDGRVTRATTARMVKRKTNRGQTRRVEEIMLPGYVFVEAPADMGALPVYRGNGLVRVLYGAESDWRLYGSDKTFAVTPSTMLSSKARIVPWNARLCLSSPLREI